MKFMVATYYKLFLRSSLEHDTSADFLAKSRPNRADVTRAVRVNRGRSNPQITPKGWESGVRAASYPSLTMRL